MAKKYLTIDDLYAFYADSSKRTRHFNAKTDDDSLVVQIAGTLKFEDSNKDIEGLLPVHLQACHTGQNLNHTNIKYEDMEAALPSFVNRPILGFLHEVDGELQFYGHNAHEDDDGNIIYDEIPVGVIPESCNATITYDDEYEKDYVNVDGYIYEEYTKAADVLRRETEEDNDVYVSVELAIREASFDAKTKILNIEDFYFAGVTILGRDDEGNEISPGMANSNIKIADFQKNSLIEDKLVEALNALNENLSKFNIQNLGKEESKMNHFEELLQQYGVTAEDVDFETEGLSNEELDTAFAEKFGESEPENDPASDPESDDNEGEGNNDDEGETDGEDGEGEYSLVLPDGVKKNFSLSMTDKLNALYNLVNLTYSDSDNDYYQVDAYDDDSAVVMYSWWTGAAFRQKYEENDGVFTLVGDRVAVHRLWVTDDEDKKLDEMKKNYSSVSEKLSKFEDEPNKAAIFASDEWKGIFESDEFKALAKVEAHFDLSCDEITEKLNGIVLDFAKNGKLSFAAEDPKPTTTIKPLFSTEPADSRYGGLSKKNED